MWSKIDFKRLTFPWVPLGAVDDDARSVLDEMADAVLAAIGTPDATGDLIQRAADEYGEVRFQAVCTAEGEPDGAYWAKVIESETKRVVLSSMSDSPLAAITAALQAAESGR